MIPVDVLSYLILAYIACCVSVVVGRLVTLYLDTREDKVRDVTLRLIGDHEGGGENQGS